MGGVIGQATVAMFVRVELRDLCGREAEPEKCRCGFEGHYLVIKSGTILRFVSTLSIVDCDAVPILNWPAIILLRT